MSRDGLLLVAERGEEPRIEVSDGPFRIGGGEPASPEEVTVDWYAAQRQLRIRGTLFRTVPLYWHQEKSGRLRVASKVRRLFESGVPRAIEPARAAAALAGLPLPAGSSLYRGVRSLPPGTMLIADGAAVRVVPVPRVAPPEQIDPPGLRRLVFAAVERRMAPGTTFCALSGGVDSSWMVALAAKTGGEVIPVTVEDGGRSPEEVQAARRLCAALELSPRAVHLAGVDISAVMPEAVEATETLLWNGLAVERYLAFRRLHEEGAVLLSGAGADELFLGQPAILDRDERGRPLWRRRLLEDAALVRSLLKPGVTSAVGRPPRVEGDDPRPYLTSCLLPESTLPIEARAAAACGLRVRFPYLDPEVEAAARGLPVSMLLQEGCGKYFLRRAAALDLSPEHAFLPKRGGASPAGGGLRSRRQWLLLHRRWLSHEALTGLPFLRPGRVSELLDAFAVIAPGDARREVVDRVLMRLSSLSVLQHGLVSGMTRALALPADGIGGGST